jgi:D-amino-acid dehydrogenase
MLRLAFYSRDCLHDISAQHNFEYDTSSGYSVLLRSEKDLRRMETSLQVLRDAQVPFEQLSAAQMRVKEPALNPDTHLEGGIYLPNDEVANCRQFAMMLKNKAQGMGVRFEFSTGVSNISSGKPVKVYISGENTPRVFDQMVLCAGVDTARLLRPLGLKIPLAAVYGYSVSASIREPLNAPVSALMDEQYKVSISRLGKRIRVAGTAELGGSVDKRRAASLQTLYKVLYDWFPGAVAHLSNNTSVQEWKGARPMLPDGPPIVGASGLTGLWINSGHGASGWTLSCGSARALADMVNFNEPSINMDGLGVSRLL